MIRVIKDSLSRPGLFCWLLLPLICISFAIQSLQVRSFLVVSAEPVEAMEVLSNVDFLSDAASLFDLETTSPLLPAAQLKLSLLACFLQSDADRSVALISVESQPPRRVRVGEEIGAGVRLLRVEARRVLLSKGGQRVSLGLQRSKAMPIDATLHASVGVAE